MVVATAVEETMTPDYLDLDAVGQSELVRQGAIAPAELIEATIERIAARDRELSFLASEQFEAARELARRRPLRGPLAGVGLLLKDLIDYPGMACAYGCRLLAAAPPGPETPYARALADAGLIPLGRTTSSELGLLGSTESLLCGVTRNPWGSGRSAGGSSGGAAAAVASRAVPLAHASDGGGSIRGPASINGVFGFKPSAGRSPATSQVGGPLTWLVSDHCVSLSVRDSAAFLAATERSGAEAELPPVGYVTRPLDRTLTIGYYDRNLVGCALAPAVRSALARAVQLCCDLGHQLIEIEPPPVSGERVSAAFFTLAGATVHGLEQMVGCPLTGAMVEPFTLALLEWFRARPAGAVERARSDLQQVRSAVLVFAQQCDVLLTPTLAIEPPELGYLAPDLPLPIVFERMGVMAGFTVIHNIAGLPAMSVPLDWSEGGLPIGSQFAAGPGQEGLLLGLAYQLEAARPWRERRPASAQR